MATTLHHRCEAFHYYLRCG